MIKLIAADLDGTCLNSKTEVSNKTLEILTRAIQKGILFVPSTGRTESTIPEKIIKLPGLRYILTSSGAVVYDLEANQLIYENRLTRSVVQRVLEIIKDFDVFLEVYQDGTSYVDEDCIERIEEYEPNPVYVRYFLEDVVQIENKKLLEMLRKRIVEKINVRLNLNDYEKRSELISSLKKIPELMIVDQVEGNIEVTSAGANKGTALKELADYLGISKHEIMSIGDSDNDLPMFAQAGLCVAMGQSGKRLKETADYIAASNDEDGMAGAIEKFILESE